MNNIMVPEDLKKNTMRVSELVPYVGNAKKHPEWQVEQIVNSIQAFGFNDPIAIWQDIAGHWVIVEGHGRLLAAKELGMDEVPVIRVTHLDDEGRRAYTLAHNKLTMNTEFDPQILHAELDAIEGLDMEEFGFTDGSGLADPWEYTDAVKPPQYEPTGMAELESLADKSKYDELVAEIESSDGISPDEVAFLKDAATRHIVFDYEKIADYYAGASPQMQRQMEKSALVILDMEDAIANGYAQLAGRLSSLMGDSDEE